VAAKICDYLFAKSYRVHIEKFRLKPSLAGHLPLEAARVR
jgi:hypothetical protein